MRIKFLLSFVVSFLFSTFSYGQTTTWKGGLSVGGSNADISIPGNWTNGLPNNIRAGIINDCSSCSNPVPTIPIAGATFTGATITIQGGGNINFSLNTSILRLGTLNINNSLTFIQGTINATTINITNNNPIGIIVDFGSITASATNINVLGASTLNTSTNIGIGSTITVTTLKASGSGSTINLRKNLSVTNFLCSSSTVNLDNHQLTTTNANTNALLTIGLVITESTINSADGGLIAKSLNEIAFSTFIGNIKITASKGNTSGGNTFNGITNFEFSNVGGPLNLNTTVGSIYKGNTIFKNTSSKNLTVASHSNNNTISDFRAPTTTTFINEGTGAINVATTNAIIKTNNVIVQNTIGTFTLATGTSTVSGIGLEVINGGTTNLSISSACTFANVILTNNVTSSIITTANTTQPLGTVTITNSLVANFFGGGLSTINLNNVTHTSTLDVVNINAPTGVLGASNADFKCKFNITSIEKIIFADTKFKNDFIAIIAPNVGSGASTSKNCQYSGSINNLAIINSKITSTNDTFSSSTSCTTSVIGGVIVNNGIFDNLLLSHGSSKPMNMSGITCNEHFVLDGAGAGAVTFSNTNTFAKDLTFNRQATMTGATMALNGSENQSILSTNPALGVLNILNFSMFNKTNNSKTIIGIQSALVYINIFKNGVLTLKNILDCSAGTLANPLLTIANDATITGNGDSADNKSFIVGAIKKIGNFSTTTPFVFPIGGVNSLGEFKYNPLTFVFTNTSATPSGKPTSAITAGYVLGALNTPPDAVTSNCEYWNYSTNFTSKNESISLVLGFVPNFCTTRDNGFGLKTFIRETSVSTWNSLSNDPPNTASALVIGKIAIANLQANKNNQIALGYLSLLELDLSEVAVKDFTLTTTINTVTSDPINCTSGGSDNISISPEFLGATKGILTLNFPRIPVAGVIPSKITINLINPGLLNTTQIANTNNDVNLAINNGLSTSLNGFYKITNTPPREATIKFYKLPQIAPSTALGITSNLVNGIKFVSDLKFDFSNPSLFELNIYNTTNLLPLFTLPMTTSASSLTWTPTTTLAPGTYKFTLKDLNTLKVYNGQFIKQ